MKSSEVETHKFLVELPDGSIVRKAMSDMGSCDYLVFEGPDASKDFEEMQKAFDREVEEAGGMDAWRYKIKDSRQRRLLEEKYEPLRNGLFDKMPEVKRISCDPLDDGYMAFFESKTKAFRAEAYLDGKPVKAITADVGLGFVRAFEEPIRIENDRAVEVELHGKVEIRFHKRPDRRKAA